MESFAHAFPKTGVPPFTHLKVYSSYTLGIGVNTPAEICAHASRAGYRSVGLTDIGGTYGFVEFHLAAKRHGIKPIYGIAVRHEREGRRSEEPSFITLIAVSPEGMRNIAELASLSATEAAGAVLDAAVLGAHAEGVVAAVGSGGSEIARLVRDGDTGAAERAVGAFREVYGDRFFVEVQDHGTRHERAITERLLALSSRIGAAPLLTHEARYVDRRMRDLYGTLRGIRHPTEERDFFPGDPDPSDWSLRTPSEMLQLRPFYEAAYDNATRIDEMIGGDLMDGIHGGGREAPDADGRERIRSEILERCGAALARRGVPNGDPDGLRAVLSAEADHAVAEGRGPMLLLFHRVMSDLRTAGVEPGPATGLELQSACAFLLGITSYDPYSYDKGFHPGFDGRSEHAGEFELQVPPEARGVAVERLFASFEYGRVAFVPVIERVTPAKAVRMAATVSNVTPEEIDEVQEVIGRHPGVSLERIREIDARLGAIYRRSLGVREVVNRAALLEDLPVGIVRSRRSLAVSPVPLTEFLGCSIDSETGDLFVQAGRENFPVAGVYRVDVTSLAALGVCVRTERELRKAGPGGYGWGGLPLDEADVWREVQRGDPTGIFLFEGQTTVQLRSEFALRTISDLTNFLALMRLRDGDRSMKERMESYARGNDRASDSSDGIRAILSPTRGFLLYHEQVRDIIVELTGVGADEAWKMTNDLREASPGGLSAVRSRFMVGAADTDVPFDVANRWFERLMRHSRATISRKRVFADALLVYKLFVLKTRHEPWFYAALLNASLDSEGKLEKYLGPARARGMILGVDVNRSRREFAVEEGRVRSGLGVVDLADEKIERMEKARSRRAFDSLDDFVKRVGARHLERGDVRRLIEAGAFDGFDESRSEMLARLPVLFGKRTARVRSDAKGQLEFPFDS